MKAIYLKEMRSYFHSLAAYIYFALFIAATGVYFSVICLSYGYTDYAQYVFSNSTILYIVIVPILTMRLFAKDNAAAIIWLSVREETNIPTAIRHAPNKKYPRQPVRTVFQFTFPNILNTPASMMRLFAEEKKQRTDQLLYTSPIRSGSIVFGKYLASSSAVSACSVPLLSAFFLLLKENP